VKNLRGIDDSHDVDRTMLVNIYERIKMNEFQPLQDHVKQVIEFQNRFVGDKLDIAQQHRRLVCYCRLFEIESLSESAKINLHQREAFLFNDIIVIAKISNKKKTNDMNLILIAIFHLSNLNITFLDCEGETFQR
jgi:IQ motif/SEC7 domain-containing protein